MATLLNSVSHIQNPSSEFARKDFRFSDFPLNLSFRFPRKGFSRVLVTTQMNTSPKDNKVFTPDNGKSTNIYRRASYDRLNEEFVRLERLVNDGHTPDPKYATQLILKLCKYDRLLKACRVLELMVKSDIVPKAETFCFLVRNIGNKGGICRAMQLVEQMEAYGYQLDSLAYNSIVKGLCRSKNLYQALNFVNTLNTRGQQPNEQAHQMLVQAAYKHHGADEAIRVLKGIINGGGKPSKRCYDDLLTALCREGRTDEAVKLFRSWPTYNTYVGYTIIFHHLCLEARWDEAKVLAAEMIDGPGSSFVYNSLITSLSLHGKIDQALEVLDEMYKAESCIHPARYNPIMERLAKEKRIGDIVKCLDQMVDRHCKPTSSNYGFIAVLCAQGMVKEAFSILKRFSEKHQFLNYDFCPDVIKNLSGNGNVYWALQFMNEMVDSGYTPNSSTYAWLIVGLCFEQKWKEAFEIFLILGEGGHRWYMDDYNWIIRAFRNCRKFDLAFEVYEYMIKNRCMPNQSTYAIIVKGLMSVDKLLALYVLKELRSKRVLSESTAENIVIQYDLIDVWESTAESRIDDDEHDIYD